MIFQSRKYLPLLAKTVFLGRPIISPRMGAPFFKFSSLKEEKEKTEAKGGSITNFKPGSTGYAIKTDDGLQRFIQKCIKTTGLSILGMLSVAELTIIAGMPLVSQFGCLFVGIGVYKTGDYYFREAPFEMRTENINGVNYKVMENSQTRKIAYAAKIAGMGVFIAPFMGFVQILNPLIIIGAGMLTLANTAAASLYIYMKPINSVYCRGCIIWFFFFIVMIDLAKVGAAAAAILSPKALFALKLGTLLRLFWACSTIHIAESIYSAIKMYENGVPDHLDASLDFLDNILSEMEFFIRSYIQSKRE